MYRHKWMKLGCAIVITTTPFHASALTREAGLNACVEAMVEDIATRQGSDLAYNIDPTSTGGKAALGRWEVFHLDAFDPVGERVVARMDCEVNRKAKVTKLIKVPLDGKNADVRATSYND